MDEVLNLYQKEIAAMTFLPSSGGVFEVTVGGELIFSKKATNRFPEDGEVAALLAQKQGW